MAHLSRARPAIHVAGSGTRYAPVLAALAPECQTTGDLTMNTMPHLMQRVASGIALAPYRLARLIVSAHWNLLLNLLNIRHH